jgi:hypothetical protein
MDYQEYLKTDHWKRLAEETKRLAGYHCQVCNSVDNLEAHHRTYERKGDELQSDLTCLCHSCHSFFSGSISIKPQNVSSPDIEIEWDEDHDERIYECLQIVLALLEFYKLPSVVGEHEGVLVVKWKNMQDLQRGKKLLGEGINLKDDYWIVQHEIYARKI